MSAISRFLSASTLAALLVSCGGDGNGKSQQVKVQPPEPPVVTVDADIKQLIFTWAEVPGATHYELLENPDGHSGFTQVGVDIAAGTLSATMPIAVHLHDFPNALYIVEACNATGCNSSSEVNALSGMLDAIGYFKASNTDANDYFAVTVALSADGDTLAVGAPNEDSNATGINGDQNDISAPWSGAAYLFRFDGTDWSQQVYIKASNTEEPDMFGREIALSADASTLAVGATLEDSSATGINGDQSDNSAPNSGAVYLFRFDGTDWAQRAYVKASNTEGDGFGQAVALSADGTTLAVGAPAEDSNATGINGDQTDNSAVLSGAVYVY